MASLVLFNYTQHSELWASAYQCGDRVGFSPLLYLPCWGQMAFCSVLAQCWDSASCNLTSELTNGWGQKRLPREWHDGAHLLHRQWSPLTELINSSTGKPLPCLDRFPSAMILSLWACWQQVACLCDDSDPAITLAFCPIPPQRCSCWRAPGLCFWAREGQCAQGKPSSLGYSAFLGLMDWICWPWRSTT